MSVENLEKILASASDVKKWWKANKHTIETSERVKNKWEDRCERAMIWLTVCGVPLGSLGFGLHAFIDVTGNTNAFLHILTLISLTGGLIAIFGFFGVWGVKAIFGCYHQSLLSQHYQEATNRWGLNPRTQSKV